MQQNMKKRDDDFLICAYLLLSCHSIYRCFNYLFKVIGINIPYLMDIIYASVLILAIGLLWKNNIKRKALFHLLGVYCFFFVNYLWAIPEAKMYFKTADMKAVLMIYIPISILCISRIKDWNKLFSEKKYLILSDILITVNLFAKLSGIDRTNYMFFSYDLLPIWAITFISAFCYGKKMQWIFMLISIIEGIIFGSRGPLIWFGLLIVLTGCCKVFQKKGKKSYIIYVLGMIVIIFFILEYILPILMESKYAETSYVINRLREGTINTDAGRNEIYIQCRDIIKKMGMNVYGMFFDRTVLINSSYAHNIIYEILLTMGWFFGSITILRLLYIILSAMIVQKGNNKINVWYFICTLFLRYFISGSIFDEGNFWIFVCAIYSLRKKY